MNSNDEKKPDNLEDKKNLIIFSCISDFIKELGENYGEKYKMLFLYSRILQATGVGKTSAIKRNIELFRVFCQKNKEQIASLSHEFSEKTIEYSKKVSINMHTVFEIAAKNDRKIIWKHLITIYGSIDPSSKAKEILRKLDEDEKKAESTENKPSENNFVHKIMSKVEQSLTKDASPKEVLNSVIQSGLLSDVFDDMKGDLDSGKMDMSRILGSVQGMLSELSSETGGDPEAKKAVDMLSGMSSMMGGGGGGGAPDISGMLGMVAGMMGNMGNMGNMGPPNSDGNA